MKVTRLSHSAGRNLGPGRIVVNSQFQTHREILKLHGARKCHLFPMPARESPTLVYHLKGYCIRALKKTKSGCDSQVVIRECWASSREEKNWLEGILGEDATHPALLSWPQIARDCETAASSSRNHTRPCETHSLRAESCWLSFSFLITPQYITDIVRCPFSDSYLIPGFCSFHHGLAFPWVDALSSSPLKPCA